VSWAALAGLGAELQRPPTCAWSDPVRLAALPPGGAGGRLDRTRGRRRSGILFGFALPELGTDGVTWQCNRRNPRPDPCLLFRLAAERAALINRHGPLHTTLIRSGDSAPLGSVQDLGPPGEAAGGAGLKTFSGQSRRLPFLELAAR